MKNRIMNNKTDIYSLTEKYMAGESSREELQAMIELFNDPYHHLDLRPALYEHWTKDDAFKQTDITSDEFIPLLDKIHHRIRLDNDTAGKKSRATILIPALKVAAILILGLIAGIFLQYLIEPEPVYYTSISPKGSVSQLILPDNTMVFLNAGSEIKYSAMNNKGIREVFLDGEAWFDVTHNQKIPFVVHTSAYDVQVLGTQFNVKAYKEDPEVVTTLVQGSVRVMSSERMKLREDRVLAPGEQLIFRPETKTMEVLRVNPLVYTSWKDNKLIFINMNLKELIVLMERKYGVDIEVTDNVVLDYHYDGTIKNESVLEVLDLLRETLPIEYKIKGQTIFITKK